MCFALTNAQNIDYIKEIHAIRLTEKVTLDGILSEDIWKTPGLKDFYQREPNQGMPASELTEVWVAYDDNALYIAAKLYDKQPDSIFVRLARRDYDVGSDFFAVFIDSYHDHKSGYVFAITAAGTLADGIMYNDDWNDFSWDGVWEAKKVITNDGWTIEMKIPFSQLRFKEKKQNTWGINFERFIGRKKEEDYIVYTPRNESGFVSRFPHLIGIQDIDPPARFEIVPYATARAEFTKHEINDPFNDGSKYAGDIGLDFKWGLGSNLTINGTINPDFGQVEVDPAVINLTDVETYLGEKRPFFIEGMNIFSFGKGGVTNYWSFNWSSPSIFYSRRIGRIPQGTLPQFDYSELPIGTHILGAIKFTGKILDNWEIGGIQAITKREYARIQVNGKISSVEIEPLTSYSVARIQRDFDNGKQGAGLLITSTNRFFDDLRLKPDINENAYVGAIDGWTALDNDKEYILSGWTAFSHVEGTTERIYKLQKNYVHYFQRPDASHITLNKYTTHLNGYAGRLTLNKQKGNTLLNSSLGFISPGFDVNDLGYISRADIINFHIGTGYKWNSPTDYYRYINILAAVFGSFDFGWSPTAKGIWGGIEYQLPSYHYFGFFGDYAFESYNNYRTRGGPKMLNPSCYEVICSYYSDNRKKFIYGCNIYNYEGKDGFFRSFGISFTFRPLTSISISFNPAYKFNLDRAQWINNYDDSTAINTYYKRYIFSDLIYKELSAELRLDWTFTPTLSFQVYIQPLIASGSYSNFKELTKPRSFNFRIFGEEDSYFSDSSFSDGSRKVYLDPDGNGKAPPIELNHPNFRSVSLRGNAILRWEYLPGSTLYFVWTQSRYEAEKIGVFKFNHSVNRLANTKPDNIFMLKLTYWFGK